MERSEDVAFVFGRELVARVKAQVKRRRVRLHEYIGNDHFVGELRMFSFVAWIGVVAEVKPRPAIEATGPHTADVIRRQILADFISLVRAHPELVAVRTKCDSHCIADSPRVK